MSEREERSLVAMHVLCIDQELAASLNFVSWGLLEFFSALCISRNWVLVSPIISSTSQIIVQHIVHYFLHAHLFFFPTNHDLFVDIIQGGGALDIFAFVLSNVELLVKFTSMTQLKIQKHLCYSARTRLAPSIANLLHDSVVNESQPKLARFHLR